jgi:dolichol-phosphate mannosyltransferase
MNQSPDTLSASRPDVIVVPTYNEKENLPLLVPQVRRTVPQAHLLIVDDNSPDGTGQMADAMADEDSHIHVLHRTAKDGLGRAYLAGFGWALPRGYSRIVQMDADLSHDPKYLPQLLQASQTHDLVLGSRYVPGGGTVNWGWTRRVLSRGGSLYARTILGLRIRDLTGGFKCWRRHVLEDIDLPSVRSNGYSFQIEMTYRALLRGHTIQEVPIVFADRTEGQSKMSKKIVLEAIGMVWKLRAQARAIRAARPDTNSSGGATLGAATKS